MRASGSFATIVATAVLSVSPGLARADGSMHATQHAARQTVNTQITQRVGPDCRYVASVRGYVRPVAGVPLASRSARLEPNLAVDGSLECRGVVRPGASTARLVRGGAMDADQLARSLAASATVHRREGERICAVAPRFRVDGTHVRAVDVTRSCQTVTAWGGGPRPSFEGRE